METVWVLGDQLSSDHGALRDRDPATTRVLLVESSAKIASKRWHRQRLHVVLASMRKFAAELRDAGFDFYQILINLPWVLHRFGHRPFGDCVEHHA